MTPQPHDYYLTHALCSRCGGADTNCPVCHTTHAPANHDPEHYDDHEHDTDDHHEDPEETHSQGD